MNQTQIGIDPNTPELIYIFDEDHFISVRVTNSENMTIDECARFTEANPCFALASSNDNDWYFTIEASNLGATMPEEALKIFSKEIFEIAFNFWDQHTTELTRSMIGKPGLN